MSALFLTPLTDGVDGITMSHRLTKEELDEQFELFLKESVSDDSVELSRSDKQLGAQSSRQSVQKPTVSWWEDDEHSRRTELAKSRFIKARKSQPEDSNVVTAEPFYKPVPKPRSKAPDNLGHLDVTRKNTVLEVSQTVERQRTSSDDWHSASLSLTHDDHQCVSGQRSPDETRSNDTRPASTDSQGDSEDGLLGSGKTFRKSLRNSQSIREEEEKDPGDAVLEEEGPEVAATIKDSTETEDSVMVPAVNTTNMGLDTLEEEVEKARFFAQLEAGASTTIDYSKLNMELDLSSSTTGTNLRKAKEAIEQSDDDQRKTRVTETIRESPAVTGSPHYSEDFEEEEDGKEPLQKSKMSPILAKVSLYDSLDDTGGDDRRKDTAGSLDRGQSYVQSGGSEMEALHEAYRQIHVVEDSDDHNHHHSSARGISSPVSPSSPRPQARQSLQPASTNESELPTAEELMRPIRPDKDHIRGFTLQPVSSVEPDQEKASHFFERTVPDPTQPGSQLKHTGAAHPTAGLKGEERLSSPDPPIHNLTWSIRQEVERLMQDQNKYSSDSSSQANKAKKQPAFHGSSISHLPTSSARKPAVAPVRGRRVERSIAPTSKSSGLSRAAAAGRAQSAVSRPLQHAQEKAKVTKSRGKDEHTAEPGVKVSSELVASVQSLVAVLQQQIDTSSHQDATHTLEARQAHSLPQDNAQHTQTCTLHSQVEELRVQLAQKERELQVMKEGAEELNSLRQQNYLLQSKLRSADEAGQKKSWADASDSAVVEKLQQMEKDRVEQEMLIKGYQQENEKLYLQMKAQQVRSKANEEAMFSENQRLLNELALSREQLHKTSRAVGSVCSMDHTQRITDLLAQLNTFQRHEDKLSEDIRRLKQEKQSLEVDLQLTKKERDLAKAQAISASGDKTFEMHVLEDRHREEVVALKKKLQWFAENQELLDRDAGRLKAATAEIQQLKEQVEKLKMDVGKRSGEQQRKAREKSVDIKRMQDLERQVKELEQILRRRNPNSLPALIYAAATAGSHEDEATRTSPPSRISALLERRIQRLEAELESHDEEAKRSLRAMEQQFHRVKLRYEQQISELEQQLEAANSAVGTESRQSQVQTLKEELQHVKETHKEREQSLQDQIESLQQQLKQKTHPSPARHQRQAEEAVGVRIERLNQELSAKTQSIRELSRTVERLQKERRSMLCVPSTRAQTRSTETKQQAGPVRTLCSAAAAETCGVKETFPAAQYEKTYQPTVFTGSHISEVQQENEALRQQLELLELQSKQDKEALKVDATQAREELSRIQEHCAEQLSSMKAEHLRVLEQLRASHALEHSASRVAELANKLNTQELTVKHLQEQLRELQGVRDALAISRTREDALQTQLTRLLKDLKESKEAQSPEVKLLCSLERKILNMELRHQHREKELQQVIGGSWQTLDADQQSEVEHWKHLARDKSRELEAFRLELDSILNILRHLQRQGVVLPATAPTTHIK
ncbi:centrosomal protein of 162 kDa isoform X5 [Acanthopagrus latus]|uniref:centrosomal protein of 162 kDa isoform X5 n=1 Tax=Acanthopagrus latus TaxID=8177 RepID=UPI00187D07CA|nr:centrosomal protein of 162 kDa isoform X5 [Acanthopagrus latus]